MQHSAAQCCLCSATAATLAQRSMNDETYLAHWFCFFFASRGHQCNPGELKLKAERLLVSYSPLAHDVGFQGYRAFRIAASGL